MKLQYLCCYPNTFRSWVVLSRMRYFSFQVSPVSIRLASIVWLIVRSRSNAADCGLRQSRAVRRQTSASGRGLGSWKCIYFYFGRNWLWLKLRQELQNTIIYCHSKSELTANVIIIWWVCLLFLNIGIWIGAWSIVKSALKWGRLAGVR